MLLGSVSNQLLKTKAESLFSDSVDYSDLNNWIEFDEELVLWVRDNHRLIDPVPSSLMVLSYIVNSTSYLDTFRAKLLKPMSNIMDAITSSSVSGLIRSLQRDVLTRTMQINGENVYLITPQPVKSAKIVLFVHGGGYLSVNAVSYTSTLEAIASLVGCQIVLPEYPKTGNIDEVARHVYLVSTHFSPHWDNIVLMGDSSGTTIINRLVYLENRTLPVGTVQPYVVRDIVLFYPFLVEVDKLSPGRFLSLESASIINLRFHDTVKRSIKMKPTEYNWPERYFRNNIVSILSAEDYLLEDGLVIARGSGKSPLIISKPHGFFNVLYGDPSLLRVVVDKITREVQF